VKDDETGVTPITCEGDKKCIKISVGNPEGKKKSETKA
jgi:hypothetical protein